MDSSVERSNAVVGMGVTACFLSWFNLKQIEPKTSTGRYTYIFEITFP